MKYFKYLIVNRTNIGTEEEPVWKESFYEKKMPYADFREEIVKAEAYKGEYPIEDDGQPEPEPTPSEESVWDELDAAYQKGVDSL